MSTKIGTILADFTTTLATDTAVGATSATLSSATDDDGVALPSGRYFFTLDGDNSSKEHISCDLSGTSITNIKSLSRQGVETTGVARKHRIGASVSLTDFGHIKFINDLVSGATNLNAAAPLGYDGAPASLAGNQLATVTYVLGVVNGGAVTFDQQTISNQTSGEALAVNDVVYFKESDSLWYKVDADLTATFDQLQMGICKTVAASSGVTIQVAISGPVSGFTGLTSGSKYYASNTAGGISTSAGTFSVFVGWALNTTTLLFTPFAKTLPTQKEKDAMAGGSTFGTPSSTNKFITQDYNASATGIPVVQTYDTVSTEIGSSTTQFDITNPSGTTFRYTWDSTGTDPSLSLVNNPIGSLINFQTQNFNANNNGVFVVTGAGANYVEVTNASGVVESNKTIGTGYIVKSGTSVWTKPTGLKYVVVEVIGGGGPGIGLALDADGGQPGGGAGGYSKKIVQASSLGATEYYLVGAGGVVGSAGAQGKDGRISQFGSHCYATGGTAATSSLPGTSGVGVNGTINTYGTPAGGGSTGAGNVRSGHGGSSFYGGGGDPVGTSDSAGVTGKFYGGGGSGAYRSGSGSALDGGAGFKGVVFVTEYYS